MYTHHGIDVGDGTVVHFSGEPLRLADARVELDSMEVFCGGHEPRVVAYGAEAQDAEVVIETALSMVGMTGYQLWRNNCEHFASHCKTGEKSSPQVKRALKGLATAAGAAATLSVAGIVFWASRRNRAARNLGEES